jgi:A/G-specific adenine glycosylase
VESYDVSAARFSDGDIADIRARLLAWYDASARDLPWRRRHEPYATWISEVMAQQTRIDTVVPYFERWIARFPDVAALAAAPVDDVLRQWEGLGYYSRARNLHAAARVVRDRHAGELPPSYDQLRALPGIGDYTAGAVASIAFGVRAPAVDGNVRRVLARLLDEADPAPARVRQVAAALVPADRPGDFNQAVMELGAMVCTPRSPRCDRCPVAPLCAARAAGTQLDRPARKARAAVPAFDIATAVLCNSDGRVLLVRRPPQGLLADMWSFPGVELGEGEDAAAAAARLAAALTGGAATAEPVHIGSIDHTFSHRRERYVCFMVRVADEAGGDDRADGGHHMAGADVVADVFGRAWVGRDAADHALPRAQRKILNLAFEVRRRGWPR